MVFGLNKVVLSLKSTIKTLLRESDLIKLGIAVFLIKIIKLIHEIYYFSGEIILISHSYKNIFYFQNRVSINV